MGLIFLFSSVCWSSSFLRFIPITPYLYQYYVFEYIFYSSYLCRWSVNSVPGLLSICIHSPFLIIIFSIIILVGKPKEPFIIYKLMFWGLFLYFLTSNFPWDSCSQVSSDKAPPPHFNQSSMCCVTPQKTRRFIVQSGI